ncbi:vesicle-associated membrane protein 5-like [Strigops habroptila]|uniref:vesicle-associated membrane protein 5-like n=1 Tax=Strigops habroptila TaxID=2489341 RepID=UPI0011CF50D5|nr:vesicle-associated membrane protein 5-like [Strigops habroptila]
MAGLWQCQREAEAVAGLMQQNMLRALERDGRLRDLDTRAQSLRAMSESFSRSSRAVALQRPHRSRRRWAAAAAGTGLVLIVLLVLVLVLVLRRDPGPVPAPPGATGPPPAPAEPPR